MPPLKYVYSLTSCYILVLFIYSLSVYHILLRAMHSAGCPEFTKTKLLPTTNTTFISKVVVINMSISGSDLEFFGSSHCLVDLCMIRAGRGAEGMISRGMLGIV